LLRDVWRPALVRRAILSTNLRRDNDVLSGVGIVESALRKVGRSPGSDGSCVDVNIANVITLSTVYCAASVLLFDVDTGRSRWSRCTRSRSRTRFSDRVGELRHRDFSANQPNNREYYNVNASATST